MRAIALLILLALPTFGARDFPGNSTDKITAATSLSGNTFSFSALIWIDGAGSSGFGNLARPRGNNAHVIYVNSTNLVYEADFSTADGAWAIARPSTGTWHHLGITYDGSSTSNDPIFYVDGVSQSLTTDTNPTGTFSGSGAPFFGNNNGGTTGWDGRMAEVAMWTSRILTASQMASLAKRASPLFYDDSLDIYIPMVRENFDLKGTAPTIVGTTVIEHPQVISTLGLAQDFSTTSAGSFFGTRRRRN